MVSLARVERASFQLRLTCLEDRADTATLKMVRAVRVELTAFRLKAGSCNPHELRPQKYMVGAEGFEPSVLRLRAGSSCHLCYAPKNLYNLKNGAGGWN
jgi:hypothetical protein